MPCNSRFRFLLSASVGNSDPCAVVQSVFLAAGTNGEQPREGMGSRGRGGWYYSTMGQSSPSPCRYVFYPGQHH